MSVRWHKFPDPDAAAEACCRHVVAVLEEALSGQEIATLMISGGQTPKLLFQRLAVSSLPWKRIHLFWADERCVPPTDPQSNFRMAEEHLVVPACVPRNNVHRVPAELMPDHAARHYIEEIRDFFELPPGGLPHFDLVQRGMGADAHTASLFPGEALIENREAIAAAVYVEKLKQWRVTILPGVFLAAKHNAFLVTGKDKAEAVRNVFQEEYDPLKYPAQTASHHGRRVAWFLDEAAASLMD
jgi:6-phosphogluconolactonase